MMEIVGIKSLKIEECTDGTRKVHVVYTEEFIDVLKRVLQKDVVTDEEAMSFIYDALQDVQEF